MWFKLIQHTSFSNLSADSFFPTAPLIFCCQKLQLLWGSVRSHEQPGWNNRLSQRGKRSRGVFGASSGELLAASTARSFVIFSQKGTRLNWRSQCFRCYVGFRKGIISWGYRSEKLLLSRKRVRSSKLLVKFELQHMPPGNDIFINIWNCIIYMYNCNPNDPCFDLKRPFFGGFNHQNKGQTGFRYIDTPWNWTWNLMMIGFQKESTFPRLIFRFHVSIVGLYIIPPDVG